MITPTPTLPCAGDMFNVNPAKPLEGGNDEKKNDQEQMEQSPIVKAAPSEFFTVYEVK